MDWFAKSTWIYKNNYPDLIKADSRDIRVIYIDPNSGNTKQVMNVIRDHGLIAGVYFASSWAPSIWTATTFADWISGVLNSVAPRVGTDEAPPCMLDFEEMPIEWVTEAINQYRKHQPNRPTALTDEPFQGGVLPWQAVTQSHMPYYPQVYKGDMSQADAAAVVLEACRYYGNPNMVHPFYDAHHWGTDQRDGCYFTLENLP